MTETTSERENVRERDKLNEAARVLVQAEGRLKAGSGDVAKRLHNFGVPLEEVRRVTGLTNEACASISQVRGLLASLGATGHEAGQDAPLPETLSLSSLAVLSSPDAGELAELLGLLERAQVVAERIDAARGRTVGASVTLLPGESRGTDLAEAVSELAQTVRVQLPPSGRDG